MWKRFFKTIGAVFTAALIVCPAIPANADTALRKGDTIQYTFTVGECENAAGISVDSFYNSKLLTLADEPVFLIEGQGLSNTNEQGKIRWNTMINGGRAFANDDILVETFTVNKPCSLDDTGLSFECTEIFSHDLLFLSNDLISARIDVIETGTDEEQPESDNSENDAPSQEVSQSEQSENTESTESTESKENTETDVAESSNISTISENKPVSSLVSIKPAETSSYKKVTVSSTDLTLDEPDITPSAPTSSKRTTNTTSHKPYVNPANTSSKNSSKPVTNSDIKTSSKAKANTSKTASSQTSSLAASSVTVSSSVKESPDTARSSAAYSSKAGGSTSPKTSSLNIAAIGTAGRIAIAAASAIFCAAIVAFILSKKLKISDN